MAAALAATIAICPPDGCAGNQHPRDDHHSACASAAAPRGLPSTRSRRPWATTRQSPILQRNGESRSMGFLQRDPGDLPTPASERTEAYRCRTTPTISTSSSSATPAIRSNRFRARMARREAIFSDDYVAVFLDTFNDDQRAYEFFASALGIQADGISTEGQGDDFSFDTVWYSRGRLTPTGYVVTMAIGRRPSLPAVGGSPRAGTIVWCPARTRFCRRHGITPGSCRTGPCAIRSKLDLKRTKRHLRSSRPGQHGTFRRHRVPGYENLVTGYTSYFKWMDASAFVSTGTRPNFYPPERTAPFLANFRDLRWSASRSGLLRGCCSTRPTSTAIWPREVGLSVRSSTTTSPALARTTSSPGSSHSARSSTTTLSSRTRRWWRSIAPST